MSSVAVWTFLGVRGRVRARCCPLTDHPTNEPTNPPTNQPTIQLPPVLSNAEAKRMDEVVNFDDKHGHLSKQGKQQQWQKRYFFLHGRYLRYYANAAEFRKLSRHATRSDPTHRKTSASETTVAVTEKGCYDLGRATCRVLRANHEFVLEFQNGQSKRLRAPTQREASDWSRECRVRCEYYRREDTMRVLRQMAQIQSLNILNKTNDLAGAVDREFQLQAATLRDKVRACVRVLLLRR